MALEETGTLDIVLRALDGRQNGIDLLLFDHGNTTDEIKRYTLLTEKLATYVAFVTSEEFQRDHPQTTAADIQVRVLCKFPPSDAMVAVQAVSPRGSRSESIAVTFESLEAFLEKSGIPKPADPKSSAPRRRWWFRR